MFLSSGWKHTVVTSPTDRCLHRGLLLNTQVHVKTLCHSFTPPGAAVATGSDPSLASLGWKLMTNTSQYDQNLCIVFYLLFSGNSTITTDTFTFITVYFGRTKANSPRKARWTVGSPHSSLSWTMTTHLKQSFLQLYGPRCCKAGQTFVASVGLSCHLVVPSCWPCCFRVWWPCGQLSVGPQRWRLWMRPTTVHWGEGQDSCWSGPNVTLLF